MLLFLTTKSANGGVGPRRITRLVPGLDTLVLKLLAKNPAGRPDSAQAFLLEAQRYSTVSASLPTEIETRVSGFAAPGAAAPAQQAEPTMLEDPRQLDRIHGGRQPNWRLYGGTAAMVLILGLGVAGFWVFRKSTPQPTVPTSGLATASSGPQASHDPAGAIALPGACAKTGASSRSQAGSIPRGKPGCEGRGPTTSRRAGRSGWIGQHSDCSCELARGNDQCESGVFSGN